MNNHFIVIKVRKEDFLLKIFLLLLCASTTASLLSQEIHQPYKEDQIFLSFTYNQLVDVNNKFSQSGIPYSLSLGYMFDLPLVKKGSISLGVGAMYGFSEYNTSLRFYRQAEIKDGNSLVSLKYDRVDRSDYEYNFFQFNQFSIPVEFRYRTSTFTDISFWRIHIGFMLSYNISDEVYFKNNKLDYIQRNMGIFHQFHYALTAVVGYHLLNLRIVYGLNDMFRSVASISGVQARSLRIGFILYFF